MPPANKNKKTGATKKTAASDRVARKARKQRGFETLQAEIEIAEYAQLETGQLRKKTPQSQSVARTRKRRMLEQQDAQELAVEVPIEESRKRLRGSKAAIDDDVIQGSLVFGSQTLHEEPGTADFPEELEVESADDDNEDDGDLNEDEEDLLGDVEIDDGGSEEEEAEPQKKKSSKKSSGSGVGSRSRARAKRRLYRMRSFRSQRMAKQHGEALGAHARGLPKLAIEKLRQIAHEVPSAPQVYSSLGMVYEDMFQTLRADHASEKSGEVMQKGDAGDDKHGDSTEEKTSISEVKQTRDEEKMSEEEGGGSPNENFPDKVLAEQLDLAKKAYGSYHIAAILCKKDYTLWVRAADTAVEIADIHASVLEVPDASAAVRQYHQSEKTRWLSEAMSDYKTADRLRPPGIDVPAKLAAVTIKLGHLSDALTLLTDLKNSGSSGNGPAEFESSYRVWLLYADLMLSIGYECTQWCRGVQTNGNYMFRRWLRKFADKFDWKERRLQALSKAFEAAAGSKSCRRYMEWLLNRIALKHQSLADIASNNDAAPKERSVTDDSVEALAANLSVSVLPTESVEHEKELLLANNRSELEAFDKTTNDMELSENSIAKEEREKARVALTKCHEAAVDDLVGNFQKSTVPRETSNVDTIEQDAQQSESESNHLLSASYATVFRLASALFRHLIDLGLYDGGRLLGESVSLFMKERTMLLDRRMAARRNYEHAQTLPTSIFAFHHEAYDDAVEQSDGDESDVPLSDDDELERHYEEAKVLPLRKGILPPELKVLYGLCLVAEGWKMFLAVKCLESIDFLEQESREKLTEDVRAGDTWELYRNAMTEPLGRTAAYALTADVLKALQKEGELSSRMSSLFHRQLKFLREEGVVDALFSSERTFLPYQAKAHVLRVILASVRYQVNVAESLLSQDDDESKRQEGTELALSVVDSLFHFFPLLWSIRADGSISRANIDMLNVFAHVFALLSRDEVELGGLEEEQLSIVIERLQKIVNLLCGGEIDVLGEGISGLEKYSTEEFKRIPFPVSWLSPELKRISLRTYNLCVALNVSHFSGWEEKEFSASLLRGRNIDNFYGLTMGDGRVAGYVGPSKEEELADQWEMLSSKLPPECAFNFQAELSTLREEKSQWYETTRREHEKASQRQVIGSFGEDLALSILLSFSRLCLSMAQRTDNDSQKDKLVFSAMSIILPTTQFALNKTLWDPNIGRAASKPILSEWKRLTEEKKDEDRPKFSHIETEKYVRPSKRPPPPVVDKPLGDLFAGEDESSHLANLVTIPCTTLQFSWDAVSNAQKTAVPPASHGSTTMHKLHSSLTALRSCHTEQSIEKASLQIASVLLELVASPQCHSPFLCLQHAVLFASQGAKHGNGDDYFKEPLPKMDECTPLEALVILGRADCLQSIYFCSEAAFLCSYVATVCGNHRDPRCNDLEWNEQWKIVSIFAYNVSVMIRHTTRNALAEEAERREDTSATMWGESVIEELKRGRVDGLNWKASLGSTAIAGQDAAVDIEIESGDFDNLEPEPPVVGTNDRQQEETNANGEQSIEADQHAMVEPVGSPSEDDDSEPARELVAV